MITCKEDLMNTFIINDKCVLRDAYLGKLKEFGFEWYLKSKQPKRCHLDAFEILVNKDGDIDWNEKITSGMSTRKELTLSDFKPTRTEYVKVEDSIFDLKAEFEAGGLYYSEFSMGKKFVQIGAGAEHLLMGNLSSGNLYRKVEREVTWQDEIKRDYTLKFNGGKVSMKTGAFDVDVFIEMCHKVYHLTK